MPTDDMTAPETKGASLFRRGPKRGLVKIAEDLDLWHVAYSFIIFLIYLGFLGAVPLAQRSPDFMTSFNSSGGVYIDVLAAWAFLYTVPTLMLTLWYRGNPIVQARRIRIFVRVRGLIWLMFILMMGIVLAFVPLRLVPANSQAILNAVGGYLTLSFFALLAVVGPAFVVYIVNPAVRTFFFEYPVGFREKLDILSRFLEIPALAGSRFSFLLAEVHGGTSIVVSSGFPYLDPEGLDDTFVDIQIAIRMGPPEERESVRQFLRGLHDIPYRIGTLGTTYSRDVLIQCNEVRNRMPWSDNVRRTSGIKGAWGRGIIALLTPYRDWVLLVLTSILVVLGAITLILR